MYADLINKRERSAINEYSSIFDDNQSLFYGKSYNFSYRGVENDQFLITEEEENFSILYNDVLYKNVAIKYDIYNDVIAVSDGYSDYLIVDSRKVRRVNIDGRRFINIDSAKPAMSAGFYEMAFEGLKVKLLIKRKKDLIVHKMQSVGDEDVFVRTDKYYLVTSDTIRLKRKKDLIKAFEGNEKTIAMIRNSTIKFNSEEYEPDILAILKFYESKED